MPGAAFVGNEETEVTSSVGGKKKSKRGGKAARKKKEKAESALSVHAPPEESEDAKVVENTPDGPGGGMNSWLSDGEVAKYQGAGYVNGEAATEDDQWVLAEAEPDFENQTTNGDEVEDTRAQLRDDLPSEATEDIEPPTSPSDALLQQDSDIFTSEEEGHRASIATWLTAHIMHQNVSIKLRNKLVDHIYHHVHTSTSSEWHAELRQILWRAIIRATYFWVNPDTGLPIGKAKPVEYPEGAYGAVHELFTVYAAKRADRIGRDIPTAEWVAKVEGEVRELLKWCESAGGSQGGNGRRSPSDDTDGGPSRALEHLGFMLAFDEEQKRALTREDLRERLARAFEGVKGPTWEDFEVIRPAGGKIDRKKLESDTSVPMALRVGDGLWREVVAEL